MMAPFGTIDHGNVVLSILKSKPRFIDKQGQYLAFVYTYALVNRRPPAEADMQAFFGVTPPSVHRMVVELEQLALIRRTPRQARSIAQCRARSPASGSASRRACAFCRSARTPYRRPAVANRSDGPRVRTRRLLGVL